MWDATVKRLKVICEDSESDRLSGHSINSGHKPARSESDRMIGVAELLPVMRLIGKAIA
jgi:hypothetical protein